MKIRAIVIIATFVLLVSPMGLAIRLQAITPISTLSTVSAAEKFLRVELYFGMNKHDGTVVTEADWGKFLDEEVTPKFPKGFTVVEAYGQFKNKAGKIAKEKSRVLILLYPKKAKKDVDVKLEAIRAAYLKKFEQESVLRMDFTQAVRVSF